MRTYYLRNADPDQALQGWLAAVPPPALRKVETILTANALGRITARPLFATLSSPHYPASAMDGYAVLAALTHGASETAPLRLRMGEQAIPIDTGDPLPTGCDAVIMVEQTQAIGAEGSEDCIEITAAVPPWQHVRSIGEDIVQGEMILPAGRLLQPADLAALLAGGLSSIPVWQKPVWGFIPTGDELISPEQTLGEGEILEYNSIFIGSCLTEYGADCLGHPIVSDDYALLRAAILEFLPRVDALIINAGSSAGRDDYTAELIAELGTVLEHGLALKPGKPTILGVIQGKPVVGLPGFPVSAWVAVERIIKPYIQAWLAQKAIPATMVNAWLTRNLVSATGMEEWIRVKLGWMGDRLLATPLPKGAGVVMSLVRADGLLRIPANSEGYPGGSEVSVELLRSLEAIKSSLVVTGSHDTALDLIAARLNELYPGSSLNCSHVGSLPGLLTLGKGECHLAGTHLLDETDGNYNITAIREYLPGREIALILVAKRSQGLMVAKGNPLGITGIRDLKRPGLRFVNRQRGAGTRLLLDMFLKQEQIAPSEVYGYEREEFTHLAVAAAVAGGSADAGLGILSAARSFDLEFIPLAEEDYELALDAGNLDLPEIKQLLEVLGSEGFRQDLLNLGGYDITNSGRIRVVSARTCCEETM